MTPFRELRMVSSSKHASSSVLNSQLHGDDAHDDVIHVGHGLQDILPRVCSCLHHALQCLMDANELAEATSVLRSTSTVGYPLEPFHDERPLQSGRLNRYGNTPDVYHAQERLACSHIEGLLDSVQNRRRRSRSALHDLLRWCC